MAKKKKAAKAVKKKEPVKVKCSHCGGDGSVCNTCGEREYICDCEPEEQNIGDCVSCDGEGEVAEEER